MTDKPAGKPGRPAAASLAEASPTLAATWHPERNGSLTSEDMSAILCKSPAVIGC